MGRGLAAASIGAIGGVTLGVIAAGAYHAATGRHVELSWVKPTLDLAGSLLMFGIMVAQLLFLWTAFRWATRFFGMTKGPMVTRQIGGQDIRKSRRGTEIPPLRFAIRRFWCRHRHGYARVQTHEGRELLCNHCGANMETGPAEAWV